MIAAALLAVMLPMTGWTQDGPALAARCSQLYAMADRALTRRGERSGGPNMIVQGAGIDCQKGRYAQGIKALEDLLNRNLIPYPPAQY